jgi:hypothetical protein
MVGPFGVHPGQDVGKESSIHIDLRVPARVARAWRDEPADRWSLLDSGLAVFEAELSNGSFEVVE